MQYLTAVCDGALGSKRLGLVTHRPAIQVRAQGQISLRVTAHGVGPVPEFFVTHHRRALVLQLATVHGNISTSNETYSRGDCLTEAVTLSGPSRDCEPSTSRCTARYRKPRWSQRSATPSLHTRSASAGRWCPSFCARARCAEARRGYRATIAHGGEAGRSGRRSPC